MKHRYFEKLECLPDLTTRNLDEIIEQLAFNGQGLIPVITQDAETKDVLMFAWMNKLALEKNFIYQACYLLVSQS